MNSTAFIRGGRYEEDQTDFGRCSPVDFSERVGHAGGGAGPVVDQYVVPA